MLVTRAQFSGCTSVRGARRAAAVAAVPQRSSTAVLLASRSINMQQQQRRFVVLHASSSKAAVEDKKKTDEKKGALARQCACLEQRIRAGLSRRAATSGIARAPWARSLARTLCAARCARCASPSNGGAAAPISS